jgi:hypothetical protein
LCFSDGIRFQKPAQQKVESFVKKEKFRKQYEDEYELNSVAGREFSSYGYLEEASFP